MSGVTKHIYERNIINIKNMWGEQLKSIAGLLPKEYTEQDVIELLKKYYPHEWYFVEEMYSYYVVKDKSLEKRKGKRRFNMPQPLSILSGISLYKKILSSKYMEKHNLKFSENRRELAERELSSKRIPKIERIQHKIEKAQLKTQQVTPSFLDKLIGLYERKNTTQINRLYIIRELKKYYNNKIVQFFFKVNDTEMNRQLREEAFYHLQSFNFHPRLRRQKYMIPHTKNRKKKI